VPKPRSLSYIESTNDLKSSDKDRQNHAYQALIVMTDAPVSWAYDVWDELLRLIAMGDNRQRSIAGQLLSNLAKSDPEQRIIKDSAALIELTKDERFVTARHCLLSLWKVAILSDRHRQTIADGLSRRFKESTSEKNYTLIRYDIQCVFKKIYDLTGDQQLRAKAEDLIKLEEDPKYRKSAPARSVPRSPSPGPPALPTL
jgi:hypothetical protein